MIKRLIIGIKCLFGHHTEDPYVHIIYGGNERVNVCLCCRKEFKPLKASGGYGYGVRLWSIAKKKKVKKLSKNLDKKQKT